MTPWKKENTFTPKVPFWDQEKREYSLQPLDELQKQPDLHILTTPRFKSRFSIYARTEYGPPARDNLHSYSYSHETEFFIPLTTTELRPDDVFMAMIDFETKNWFMRAVSKAWRKLYIKPASRPWEDACPTCSGSR